MKKKILALIGLTLGTTSVLIAFPPVFLTAPEKLIEPSSPTTSPSSAQPSPSATDSPAATESSEPSPIPTVTTKPIPTTAPEVSKIVTGGIYPAGKYGNVQVQITVKAGLITAAKALLYPDGDSRSSSISAAAIPVLIEQTLAAKDSSNINGASGASYTSAAWISSLQSALAK
jgi:uncharacterized protein with FMN-binding domain